MRAGGRRAAPAGRSPRSPAGQPDVDESARVPEHGQAMRDRLRPPDHVEDEVEPLRFGVTQVGCPEAACGLELALVEVERMDLGCSRDARSLYHREPDRAAADHAHTGSFPDGGGLEHRADAGCDRTADEAGLLGGQRRRERHESSAVDDGPGAERPGLEGALQLRAVREPHPGPGPGGVRQRCRAPRRHHRIHRRVSASPR